MWVFVALAGCGKPVDAPAVDPSEPDEGAELRVDYARCD
jgi:hypothetical protein